MKYQKAGLVYFSPTGTTRKILEGIAKGFNAEVSNIIDITNPVVRGSDSFLFEDDIVLIGAPVYSGRLPADAVSCFSKMKGNKIPAILVVVYGNREYEDALLELKDMAVKSGFVPIACGAFIGEHSFSCEEFPVAAGRPDEDDLKKAENFGKEIAAKFAGAEEPDSMNDFHVSGNEPYKERKKIPPMDFIEVTDKCDDCGICAEVCPNGAINENDFRSSDIEKCIYCCACIKSCPTGARILREGMIKDFAKILHEACGKRKEPEMLL